MTESLGEVLLREMKRVRDEVMPEYLKIGLAGVPALTLMRRDLDIAIKALAEGDVVTVISAYKELQGWSL